MSETQLTIGSLFSGIPTGGFDRGLEAAGLGPTRWQVENDVFCQSVLAKHWPHAVRYGDIHTVDTNHLAPVEIVCGGFPCQPASLAGQRAGQSDARWLWPEFARIVRGVRPRFVAIENVPGLLTVDRGTAFGAVLGDLAALGYDAWWDVLAAAEAGAPHRRDRLFIVAWRVADAHGARWTQQTPGVADERAGTGVCGGRMDQPGICRDFTGISAEMDGRWPATRGREQETWEPPRQAQKVPRRKERLKVLGNAVIPQISYAIGCVIKRIASDIGDHL